ncbi:tetraspanin-9-like [Saccostrea cucullata]|uniref:tetraspanin-9-like n=1 Tax=Saccostrea cuccullata TaxID=36930 RepID=UPI002ED567F0
MAMDCCGRFGKVLLIGINILFFLLGIGLLIAGIVAKVNAIADEVLPALNKVELAGNDLGNVLNSVSILVIIIGAFIVVVAGLGLFGACCEVRCMLVTYAILVLLLLLMKIAAVILWFQMRKVFNEETKEALLKSLQENFIDDSLNSTNDISNAWNYAFLTFDCCGVNRVQGTTNDFDLTPWCTTSGECQQTNAQIPKTCCVGVTESNYKTQAPADCYASVSKNYNTQGCYDRFQELVQSSSAPVIGVAITVMVIELLGFVFAIVLCKQTGSESMAV